MQNPPSDYYAPYPDSDDENGAKMAPTLTEKQQTFLAMTQDALSYMDICGSPLVLRESEAAKRVRIETQTVTSQWIVDSTNRDIIAYVNPTDFVLHLPREYKRVTAIAFNDFKMLNTFYDYSAANENIYILIHEKGRYRTNPITGLQEENSILTTIREGTYNLNTLITELNTQLNQIPLFTNISGGYTTFATAFQQTGDYSLNFNIPGDTLYNPQIDGPVLDPITGVAIRNPTMTQLVSQYFSTDLVPLQRNYSSTDTLVAYYYPVLKEMVMRPTELAKLTLTGGADDIDAVLYTFQGLTDTTIIRIINDNIAVLDAYRSDNTFTGSLVNKYVVQSIDRTLRIRISAVSISPSISKALTAKRADLITQTLVSFGLDTPAKIAAARQIIVTENLVIQDMYSFMQNLFVTYLGETLNHYSALFYSNEHSAESVVLYNGFNVPAPTKTVTATTTLNTSEPSVTVPGAGLWTHNPDISGIKALYMDGTGSADFDIATVSTAVGNGLCALDMSACYLDVSGLVPRTGYLVIPFTVNYPMDVSIETLPLAKAWQNPYAETASYNVVANPYTESFLPTYETPAVLSDTLNIIDISNNDTYPAVDPGVWLAAQPVRTMNSSNIVYLFDISATLVAGFFVTQPVYRLSVVAGAVDASGASISAFPLQVTMFFYRDKTLLLADASQPGFEDPANYFATATSTTGSNQLTITQRVIGGTHYYALVRYTFPAQSTSPIYIKVAAISTDQKAVLYDPVPSDYNTVPTVTTSTTASPDDSQYAYSPRPTQLLTQSDASGVSNDLTDYFVHAASSTRFTDPVTGMIVVTTGQSDLTLRNSYLVGETGKTITDINANTYTFVPPTAPIGELFTMKLLERYATMVFSDTVPISGLSGLVAATIPNILSSADTETVPASASLTEHNVASATGFIGRVFAPPSKGTFRVREIVMKAGIRPTTTKGQYVATDISGDPNLSITQLRVFHYSAVVGQTMATVAGLTPLVTLDASNCTVDVSNVPVKMPAVRPLGSLDIDSGIYYRFAASTAVDLSGEFNLSNTYVAVPFNVGGTVEPWHYVAFTDLVVYPFMNSYDFNTTDALVVNGASTAVLWNTLEAAAYRYSVTCKVTLDMFEYYDSPLRYLGSLNAADVSGGSGVGYTDGSIFAYRERATGLYDTSGNSNIPNSSLTNASQSGIPSVKTYLFLYDGSANLLSDVSGGTGGVLYANEQNFMAFDNNAGYETYSMIFRKRVVPGRTYYVVVRGYTPSVQFYTTVRVVGQPLVSFAARQLNDVSGQLVDFASGGVTDLSASLVVGGLTYDRTYIRCLQAMDTQFAAAAGVTFGTSSTYAGKKFTDISGFGSFLNHYRQEYSTLTTTAQFFSIANASAATGLIDYTNTYFADILPAGYTNRNRLTDAIPFSIKWYSQLTPTYAAKTDYWGLGYNLGFKKLDTDYAISHIGDFLFKLTTETIYLRMSETLPINTMTVSDKEDLAVSHESNSQVDKFFARILLNNFGSYTTTMVQTGRPINPPIGRLNSLRFQLVDKTGAVLTNNDCNFIATLSITELKSVANPGATADVGPIDPVTV